jgi:hypothetical protein
MEQTPLMPTVLGSGATSGVAPSMLRARATIVVEGEGRNGSSTTNVSAKIYRKGTRLEGPPKSCIYLGLTSLSFKCNRQKTAWSCPTAHCSKSYPEVSRFNSTQSGRVGIQSLAFVTCGSLSRLVEMSDFLYCLVDPSAQRRLVVSKSESVQSIAVTNRFVKKA